MARLPGAEDHIKLESDQYRFVINDTARLIVTSTGVQVVGTLHSASLSTTVLSGTAAQATLTAGQHFVVADATTANFGIVLPDATAAVGQTYTVTKIDASANLVILSGSGTDTISGASIATLASQNGSLTVKSDGVGWYITSRFSGALSA